MSRVYLSIDQGTTSSRAIVFNLDTGEIIAQAQKQFTQYFPNSGWVEHDGEEIWQSVCSVANQALLEAEKAVENVVGIGLTNQRETTLIWDRKTGKAIHRAIVWQDRRTSEHCQTLIKKGNEGEISTEELFEFLSATHNNVYGIGTTVSSEEARELVKKNGGI